MATTDIWYTHPLHPVASHVHECKQDMLLTYVAMHDDAGNQMKAAFSVALGSLELSFCFLATRHLPVADGERAHR